jgi:hypothetical protein
MTIDIDKEKKSEMPNILKKLGQLNEVRGELGLPMRSIQDYKKLKPETTDSQYMGYKEYGYEQGASTEIIQTEVVPAKIVIDPNGSDFQDLTDIPIPKGAAPETEGQIYKSLTQLRAIRCKVNNQLASLHIPQTLGSELKLDSSLKVEPQIVISAAPKKRDLQKELLHLVPASLKRKTPIKSKVSDPLDPLL